MKNLTANRVAFHNFKHRKKQYVLLIIGIILAMVFSSSAVFFISSYRSSLEYLRERSFGRQDALVFGADYDKMVSLANENKLLNMGIAEELGFIYNENAESKGTYIAKYDDTATEHYIDVKEGRLPTGKGEIALEEEAVTRLSLNIELGQEFTLKLKPCNGNELSDTATEKTYTLVGILTDKRKNLEEIYNTDEIYPAAVVSNAEQIEAGFSPCYGFYFDYPQKYSNEYDTFEYFRKIYYTQVTGEDYLFPIYSRTLTLGFLAGYSDIENSSVLIIILPVVLCLASCIGIINAFNSDLERRKKQIGMYRALGATKRQIIKIFGRETLLIAIICTPVSTFISFFAVKLIIGNMENFVFIPKISALIISITVSVICILLASFIPLIKASKTSPMLAIKNTNYNRKMKTKHIKTKKEFNPQKLLSVRSRKFSIGKSIAVSLLLAISIFACSVGVGYIKDNEYNKPEYDYQIYSSEIDYGGFSIIKSEKNGIINQITPELYDISHVGEIRTYNNSLSVNWLVSNPTKMQSMYIFTNTLGKHSETAPETELNKDNYIDIISSDYPAYQQDEIDCLKEKFGWTDDNILESKLDVKYDDEIEKLKSIVVDGEINIDKINSGEEIILVVPKEATFKCVTYGENPVSQFDVIGSESARIIYSGKYCTVTDIDTVQNEIKAGETATLSLIFDEPDPEGVNSAHTNSVEKRKDVKIGAIIYENSAYNLCDYTFITNRNGYKSMFGEEFEPIEAQITLDTECTDEIDIDVTDSLENILSGYPANYYSFYAQEKENENSLNSAMIAMISILALGFVLIVSMVNNAFSAQIRNGKRQIGTLRAVGASMRDIVGVYIREFIGTMSVGLIIGFGSYNLFYLIFYLVIKYYKQIDEMLPYSVIPAILFCSALFAVCSVNLFIQVRKQIKTNIVDNIREL